MSFSGHTIRRVLPADSPTLVSHLRTSKLRLAINRFLVKDWPNYPVQMALYQAAVEGALDNEAIESWVMVRKGNGEIEGWVVWTKMEGVAGSEDKEERKGEQGVRTPEGLNAEVLRDVVDATRMIARDEVGMDRLELTWLFVAPDARRKGLGRQLVQLAKKKAAAQGRPLVSCAEPQAYDFFKQVGFVDTKHADIDLSKWAPKGSGFGVFRISGIRWNAGA